MADIFPFQKEQVEEEHCCETCRTVDEYLEIALTCEDKEELHIVLRQLYNDANKQGLREILIHDVGMKMELLYRLDEEEEI